MKQFPAQIVAVDGIVENQRNEILLVKHRYKEVWTIPGGQVEIGENLIDALIREIKEESGIDVIVKRDTGTGPLSYLGIKPWHHLLESINAICDKLIHRENLRNRLKRLQGSRI